MERRVWVEALRLLLCWLLLRPALPLVRDPVPVLWMRPSSSGWADGNLTAVMDQVRLALQDLQKQPPPLGSYEIQFQLLDSQCDPAESLKALFDAMWAGPKFLLVFGEVCPSVTALIGRALPALNLVQVSFAASSPSLANRKWYGNVFSTAPSDRAVNQAAVKLLQRYEWRRVGVVTQGGARLSQMKEDLERQLLKAGVQVITAERLSGDACSNLRRLKEQDVHIIIAQFEEDSVSQVFCCAYRLNLFGARYQWILADGGTSGWRLGWQVSGCTANSLLTAADGAIRLQIRQLSNTNTAGVSGRTPQDYQDSYRRQLLQQGSKGSLLNAFVYDAVWVTAKAVSQALEAVKHREKYSVQRNVSDVEAHKMLLEAVKKTQFDGVTGPVYFRNGERMVTIDLIQFQGGSGVLVGEFSTGTQQLRLMSHLLRFKGPGPARDRTMVLLQRQHVSLLLYIVMSSAAAVTFILTLTVLLAALNRRRRLLPPGDGSQDWLLLLGLLLSSSWVLVSGLDGASLSSWTFELLCSVRLWTLSVGHSVGFAVLFTDTWRVYSVRLKRRSSSLTWTLTWMLLLDMLVLTCWQILDPLRRVELQQNVQSAGDDQDVILRLHSDHCSSSNMELWLTAVCGYKGPLLGLGCFLAWSIRMAPAGRHLVPTVLAVTAFSVSGTTASLLTSHNPSVHFCVTSAAILSCNLMALSWLLGAQRLNVCLSGSELQTEDDDEEQLSRLNQWLKTQTVQLDAEIETITMQLSDASGELTGGARAVSHAAQVCSEDRPTETKPSDGPNSPDHMWRRLSVQLPILHHSYLPAVGGVSASSSSLFGSQEAFVHHDLRMTSCMPDITQRGHGAAEPI